MSLFSGFFSRKIINPKIGDETKKTIELLRSWHNSHFAANRYCHNKAPILSSACLSTGAVAQSEALM